MAFIEIDFYGINEDLGQNPTTTELSNAGASYLRQQAYSINLAPALENEPFTDINNNKYNNNIVRSGGEIILKRVTKPKVNTPIDTLFPIMKILKKQYIYIYSLYTVELANPSLIAYGIIPTSYTHNYLSGGFYKQSQLKFEFSKAEA